MSTNLFSYQKVYLFLESWKSLIVRIMSAVHPFECSKTWFLLGFIKRVASEAWALAEKN